METNTNNTTTQARALLLAALDSYGSAALEHAERARVLVGIDGIRGIGRAMLADPAESERGAFLLGALSALLGQETDGSDGMPDPDTSKSASDGFDFVDAGGFSGVWSEHAGA
jgi:hypothetical protein